MLQLQANRAWFSQLPSDDPGKGAASVKTSTGRLQDQRSGQEGRGRQLDIPAFVKTRYKGKEWIGRLDSGADLTVFPRGMVEERYIVPSDECLTTAANGTGVKIAGAAKVQLQVGEMFVCTAGVVSPDVNQLILGLDWLCLHEVEWRHGADFACIKAAKIALYSGMELRRSMEAVQRSEVFSDRS